MALRCALEGCKLPENLGNLHSSNAQRKAIKDRSSQGPVKMDLISDADNLGCQCLKIGPFFGGG